MIQSTKDRFWEKVKKEEGGCFVWIGAKNNHGYGMFQFDGKVGLAHRYAYREVHGYLPPVLDHLCKNPACVNVAHLESVTQKENLLRGNGVSSRNAKVTHCPQGHPYSGENLYIHPTKGYRCCRECNRIKHRKPEVIIPEVVHP